MPSPSSLVLLSSRNSATVVTWRHSSPLDFDWIKPVSTRLCRTNGSPVSHSVKSYRQRMEFAPVVKIRAKVKFCVFYRNPISVFNFRKIWKTHGKGKVMMLTSFLLQITRWLFVLSYGKTSNKTGEQPVLQHCCNESEKVMLTCNLFRLLLQNNLFWDVVLTKLYSALILALEFAYNTRVVVILTLLMEPKKNWESHVFFFIN